MIKKIFFLLTIFILSCSVTFAAAKPNGETSAPVTEEKISAQENLNSSVVDTAKIFNKSQIQTLTAKIQQLEQKHKIRIGVNFLKTVGNRDLNAVANERLKKNYGDGANGGILLLVTMEPRNWNITLDTKLSQRILSYSDVAYYNEDFYNKLHNNDFFGATNVYLDSVDALLNYYEKNGTPYDRSQEFNPMALGMAILIAIVLGFAIRSWLIGSMSNVKFAREATDYLKRESIQLTEQRDTYLYTNVSRRPKSRNSNSSGGRNSGGGGSSGGGSF